MFELRPHIQIISNWQIIMRKLNKNYDNRSLTHIVQKIVYVHSTQLYLQNCQYDL